jgi:hypothetical protein
MSVIIDYFLKHPEHLQFLNREMLEQLGELAKMERARIRAGGGSGGCMPPSVTDDLVKAVPDTLVRDLVNDARRSNDVGWLKPPEGKAVEKGSGWAPAVPLEGSVPGVQHIDAIAAFFDRKDREER